MSEKATRFVVDHSDFAARFYDLSGRYGFDHFYKHNWAIANQLTQLPELEGWQLLTSRREAETGIHGAYKSDDVVLWVTARSTDLWVTLASSNYPVDESVVTQLQKLYPPVEETEDVDHLVVNFWMLSPQGPKRHARMVDIVHWEGSRDNYVPRVAEQLEEMMGESFRPHAGGQLLLWTGPPGTGKTFAIRAMADAWRKWASIEYIIDPDNFLMDPTYLLSVLVGADDNHRRRFNEKGELEVTKDVWKLVVLEDTGELLAQDSKERTGQGMSRLLNVTDGFVGQGLNNLVLITTNEELGKLHPAVTRPGRCLAHVKFEKFKEDEATRWLEQHGHEVKADRGMTLAEMFAETRGHKVSPYKELSSVGFTVEGTNGR